MEDLLHEFAVVKLDFINTLKKFPPEKRDDPLFGEWRLKDVLGHFSAWNIFFTNSLKQLKRNEPIHYWDDIDLFNKKAVEKRKNQSWDEIYNEFVEPGDAFLREYKKMPENLKDKVFWKDRKYTPLKFLKINVDHYRNAQLKEIKKYL